MTDRHVIVGSTVVEEDGRFLLVKEGKKEVRGTWNLPAGTMDEGENPVQTARRECREETGLEVEPVELVGVFVDWADTIEGMVVNFAFYSVTDNLQPVVPEDDTVEEVDWFEFDELQEIELRATYILHAVKRFRKGNTKPLDTVEDLT